MHIVLWRKWREYSLRKSEAVRPSPTFWMLLNPWNFKFYIIWRRLLPRWTVACGSGKSACGNKSASTFPPTILISVMNHLVDCSALRNTNSYSYQSPGSQTLIKSFMQLLLSYWETHRQTDRQTDRSTYVLFCKGKCRRSALGSQLLCAWTSPVTPCVQPDTCSQSWLIPSSSLHPGPSPELCLPDCVLSDSDLRVEMSWRTAPKLDLRRLTFGGLCPGQSLPWLPGDKQTITPALRQSSIPCVDQAGLENLQRSSHLCLWSAGVTAISVLPAQCRSWMVWLIVATSQS